MDPNTPATAALSHILTLLNHAWVWDYIFPRQSQPDLLHLAIMTAHSSPHPSTALMRIVTLPTPRPEHSLDETMRVLFVPSFTTGDITVGFQIFERITTNTVNTSRFYLSRTVRDDSKGMFLSVSEHPSLGTYELSYGTQLSACSREHALMLFQSGPFLEAINAKPVNFERLRQALVYSFYSIEQKPCTTCPTDQGTCICKIRTRRKRASNDFDIENNNMESYCGEFDGMASVGSFWNGCQIFRGEVCSRVVAEIYRDDSLRRRLAQWGMKEICGRDVCFRRMEVHPVVRANIFGGSYCGIEYEELGDEVLDWIMNDDEIRLNDKVYEPDSGVTRIAPAGVVMCNDRPADMDEESWKKELKRRRNREAAHRSNQKKKRELEFMKRELQKYGSRVKVLKEKEEALKIENGELREALMHIAN